jgi:hypothetical protein
MIVIPVRQLADRNLVRYLKIIHWIPASAGMTELKKSSK